MLFRSYTEPYGNRYDTQYADQGRYPDQGQYAEQGGYPEQERYPEQLAVDRRPAPRSEPPLERDRAGRREPLDVEPEELGDPW